MLGRVHAVVPGFALNERRYALSLLMELAHFELTIEVGSDSHSELKFQSGVTVQIPDVILRDLDRQWLSSTSLSQLKPQDFIVTQDDCVQLGETTVIRKDVIGATFMLLSGYEEAARGWADEHGRARPESNSAVRAGALDRPLVEEYVELILRTARCSSPPREVAVEDVSVPTHDIDRLTRVRGGPLKGLARVIGDGVATGPSAVKAVTRQWLGRQPDPYDTFTYLMDAAETYRKRAIFFFLASRHPVGRGVFDRYRMSSPFLQKQLRQISERGHGVGLHVAYATGQSLDESAFQSEMERLQNEIDAYDLSFEGVRFHYLIWDAGRSPSFLARVGVEHDWTVGFTALPGFRSGTSRSYPLYDLTGRRPLNVIEHPLVLMDRGVDPSGVQESTAAETIMKLRNECARFGIPFTFLWHNSNLVLPTSRARFMRALAPP